jgi:cation transport protein ChaC
MRLTADVARCRRDVPHPGPSPDFTPVTEALADRLPAVRPAGPLAVFAYGSLIWRSGFEVASVRRGTALGWHRQFCIEQTRWRGTPEHPGLMLALARGGRCAGLLLEPRSDDAAVVPRLVRREIKVREDVGMARWTDVRTEGGPVRAVVFWAGPSGRGIPLGLPLEAVAWRLARVGGHAGSSAEHLRETVVKLEEHGIRDRNLWRLQALVAAEIEALRPSRASAADEVRPQPGDADEDEVGGDRIVEDTREE